MPCTTNTRRKNSKIKSLLSSKKISPRTGGTKEHELEKWVIKEREEIDKTKQMYEENKRKTEQILKDTMGIDNAFADFDSTQKTLKRLINEKVDTPREGLSLRSGFSSSRRKFEQDQVAKNNEIEEQKEEHKEEEEVPHKTPSPKHQKSQKEETKDNLQRKIEAKMKKSQEITFGEKDGEDSFFGGESANGESFSEIKKAFKDPNLSKSPETKKPKQESDSESPLGAIDSEPLDKIGMRTQNIFQSLDDEAPESGRKISSNEKDPSKSLDSCKKYKLQKETEEFKDGNNMEESSQSCSLPRIKSEHVLGFGGDSSDQKPLNEEEKDQKQRQHKDALEKLQGEKNFNQPSPSPERVIKTNQEEEDETLEPLNVELGKEETISLEEGFNLDGQKPFGVNLDQTLDRSTEHEMKAVLESANEEYKNLVKNNIIQDDRPSNAILVSDDGEIGNYPSKYDNGEESSPSDIHDRSKSPDIKKDTFTKVKTKFDKLREAKEESKDDSSDLNLNSDSKKSGHSRSFEDLSGVDNIEEPEKPISNISIERIGSPNKPKQIDDRQKIDGEDEEEEIPIITGSHSIGAPYISNSEATSVLDIYRKLDSVQHSDTSNDLGLVVNNLCESIIKDLDKELFPQRPIFFMTSDMSSFTLEQATTLLQEITPRKERDLVDKIMKNSILEPESSSAPKSSKPERRSKGHKKKGKSNNKIVLYEKKGIRTDLVAVEHYVDALHKHIDKNKKKKFLKNLFSSMKHDPFEQLNQLQNSDIGSCDHFQVDLNKLATLNLDSYLEMENYWKKKEKEEDLIANDPKEEIKACTSKGKRKKPKRKRFEFDYKGLNKEQIEEKKKVFRECQHIHNKALFDCVNEALVQFRPYGKEGEPPAWSSKNRTLKQSPKNHKYDMKQIFEKVRNDMFSWCIMQAGTLPRKEFIFGDTFDEELFAEIREKKLATLLATEVIDDENTWLDYDFEEAQVRIDLGDMILEQLVSESIAVMNVVEETEHKKSIFTDKDLVEKLIINEPYYYDANDMYSFDDEDINELY